MKLAWQHKPRLKNLFPNMPYVQVKYRGIIGHKVVGPNGNCIFLPWAGTMYNYGRSQAQEYGLYIGGEVFEKQNYEGGPFVTYAIDLYCSDGKIVNEISTYGTNREWGHSVRAVKPKQMVW